MKYMRNEQPKKYWNVKEVINAEKGELYISEQGCPKMIMSYEQDDLNENKFWYKNANMDSDTNIYCQYIIESSPNKARAKIEEIYVEYINDIINKNVARRKPFITKNKVHVRRKKNKKLC